jgi:hypothetical protein
MKTRDLSIYRIVRYYRPPLRGASRRINLNRITASVRVLSGAAGNADLSSAWESIVMPEKYARICSALALAFVMATIAACTRSQVLPTEPTAAATPTASGLKVSAPGLVSPVGGIRIEGFRPTLVINNARTDQNVQASLMYRFEVTDLTSGTVVYDSGPVGQGAGTTSHEVPSEFEAEHAFQWRARAELPSVGNGPWSETKTFDTPARPRTRPLPTTAACIGSTPLEIVQCARAQFGYMESAQLVTFLRVIASGLNASGIPRGPYGVLLKPGGHNCGGYSCDVICSGQGGAQRQYDVLIDGDGAQIPTWGEIPQIRADFCEIVE